MGNDKRQRECVVPKILIVDDDPDIVEAGRLVLEREGYEVEEAPNRAEGMKRLEEVKPDLLILDVMMEEPDDGLRMAREIRKAGHTLPIIMLTSVNDQDLGHHALPLSLVVPHGATGWCARVAGPRSSARGRRGPPASAGRGGDTCGDGRAVPATYFTGSASVWPSLSVVANACLGLV